MIEENKKRLKFSNYFHEVIIKELEKKFNVKENDMFLGSRKKNFIQAKRMYIFVLRTIFDLSLEEIGGITNLHHASVLYHYRQVEFFKRTYITDSETYKKIISKIESVTLDEKIDSLEKQNRVNNLELTKLYNIKKRKNGKKRKELLTQ
jgi:chromosomal replication initiation ATPase DnaA|tara:strand:- start:497 stop:943 length:447 start_codon:yes stop_codon:yes gene_type:complete